MYSQTIMLTNIVFAYVITLGQNELIAKMLDALVTMSKLILA